MVTVKGTCETEICGAGPAAITFEDQHKTTAQKADATVCIMRPWADFDISLFIVGFLAAFG
jgi:hypothetical protein